MAANYIFFGILTGELLSSVTALGNVTINTDIVSYIPFNMRNALLTIILFLSACRDIRKEQQVIPAHSKKVVIKLMDSLGIVTMHVPERYDTAFVWEHETDNAPSDRTKCRFQPKGNSIFKETGFFSMGMPYDSVDQLTIVYPSHIYDLRDGDTTRIRIESKRFRERLNAEGTPIGNVLIDTCFTIHDRPIAIMGTRHYIPRTGVTFLELAAVTLVRGQGIAFQFNMTVPPKDSTVKKFVPDAIDIVKTIRFSRPV
ncbi:hypothetical protein [Chitinophaga pinensis]|uniref:Uncharacterized protein n=1 Tax=Chitinophaga pinensis TaxID=79329 RepID=A0A5C6LM66_9BACT|nr:hypothetical protein [Chitinophaga pinensis]TWV96309.1 hypothetical protein FEF09_23370 [Chitinophaga pinensis]